jgi:ferredoxin-NADP reductase
MNWRVAEVVNVVPLMAMIRARAAAGSDVDTRLLFSSRNWEDVIYRAVAEALVQLGHEPHPVKTERFGPTGG